MIPPFSEPSGRFLRCILPMGVLCAVISGCAKSRSQPDAEADGTVRDGGSQRDAAIDGAPRDSGPGPLPPPPPWEPSFNLEEEVGWRDSTEPLCETFLGLTDEELYGSGVDLWADSRGVFVVITTNHNPFAVIGVPYHPGTTLQFNDGSGWETWYSTESDLGVGGEKNITGTESGPVWLWEGPCPLRRWSSPTETTCIYQEMGGIHEADMLDASSGWLHVRSQVLRLTQSGAELAHEDVPSDHDLWGDADGVLLFGDGTLYEGDGAGTLTPLTSTPDGLSGEMWARGRNDVWVVTDPGVDGRELLHYDGMDWTRTPLGEMAEAGDVSDVWGTADALYVALEHGLYRWTAGAGVETLIEGDFWIRAMHGDEVSAEVYLLFTDYDFLDYQCGTTMVVVYDGTGFHRF